MKNKILIGMLALLLTMIGLTEVNAATYNGRLYEVWDTESGVNVYGAESNGWMDYNSWMIKSTADDKIYYCIDPAIPLEGSSVGSHNIITGKDNIIDQTRLTSSKYTKVQLLAYYGYGYKDDKIDHTSKKWYGITQVMIWRVMRPDLTWTFKKTRNGTASNSNFKEEVEEMNNLVNSYKTLPSFSGKTYKAIVGNSINLTDSKEVFYKYSLSGSSGNLTLSKNNNSLKITSNKAGNQTLKYEIASKTNETFGALVSSDFQDIIRMGKPDEQSFTLSIEYTGGFVNVQKKDETTEKAKPSGEAEFKNAVYGIYNSSGVLVGKITTDETGKGKTSLDFGNYTLKEITAPKGYRLSTREYPVNLTSTNDDISVDVFDKVITGKLKIVKTKGGTGEEFTSEENAVFDVIDKNGEMVETLKSNEKGMIIEALPYGKYTFHQTSGTDGYIFVEDFDVELYEDKIYEIDIQNLRPSKLEFTKTDYSTGEPVPDTLIEIYNEEDSLIHTCRTDDKGKCELPNLEIGKYYLLEKDAPKIYRLNPERMEFEVKENGQIIKCDMVNHRKEGRLKFRKTDSSGKKGLKDAIIEIIFKDTNKTIFKGATDSNGEVVLNSLVAGKYCIYERKAPDGYQLSKDPICFEITEEEQLISLFMKNEMIVKVPITEKNEFHLYEFIAKTLIIVGCVGGITYVVTSKKRK